MSFKSSLKCIFDAVGAARYFQVLQKGMVIFFHLWSSYPTSVLSSRPSVSIHPLPHFWCLSKNFQRLSTMIKENTLNMSCFVAGTLNHSPTMTTERKNWFWEEYVSICCRKTLSCFEVHMIKLVSLLNMLGQPSLLHIVRSF